jgi:hypothetical protein
MCIKRKRIVQPVDENTVRCHVCIIKKKNERDKREKSDDVVGGASNKE